MKREYDFVHPMVDHFCRAAEFVSTPREAPSEDRPDGIEVDSEGVVDGEGPPPGKTSHEPSLSRAWVT